MLPQALPGLGDSGQPRPNCCVRPGLSVTAAGVKGEDSLFEGPEPSASARWSPVDVREAGCIAALTCLRPSLLPRRLRPGRRGRTWWEKQKKRRVNRVGGGGAAAAPRRGLRTSPTHRDAWRGAESRLRPHRGFPFTRGETHANTQSPSTETPQLPQAHI